MLFLLSSGISKKVRSQTYLTLLNFLVSHTQLVISGTHRRMCVCSVSCPSYYTSPTNWMTIVSTQIFKTAHLMWLNIRQSTLVNILLPPQWSCYLSLLFAIVSFALYPPIWMNTVILCVIDMRLNLLTYWLWPTCFGNTICSETPKAFFYLLLISA